MPRFLRGSGSRQACSCCATCCCTTSRRFFTWLGGLYAGADGSTRWRDLLWWLIYPLLYLAWVMIRAPFAGEVPYPFLDIAANGVGTVAISSFSVLGLFLLVSAIVLAVDHVIGTRRRLRAN